VAVEIRGLGDLRTLTHLGADVLGRSDRGHLRVAASDEQIAAFRASRLEVTVLQADLEGAIRRRLGTDGASYHTLDEIAALLDRWRAERPDLVGPRLVIGRSCEGRPLWAVKISDHPEVDEDEPEVLFDALQHAREPVGMEILLHAMAEIVRRYDTDPAVRALVDEREIWFVPVVNPDGYAFGGIGGLWRKNRRPNADGSYGVDLNRNYGHQWGASDAGSSPVPASSTYRGLAPFSEPETAAIRDFALTRRFATGMTLHAFGELYLLPGDGAARDSAAASFHEELAHDLERLAGYPHGRPHELLYPSNGRAQDWLVAATDMVSIQPEIGTPGDGFWPSPARIAVLAAKNLPALFHVARIAGPHPEAIALSVRAADGRRGRSPGPAPIADRSARAGAAPGDTVELVLTVCNKGLVPAEAVAIHVTSTSPHARILRGQTTVARIPAATTVELAASPLLVHVSATATPGTPIPLLVQVTCPGGAVPAARLDLVPGRPTLLFADRGDSGLANWVADHGWGLAAAGDSAGGAFADSPGGFADSPGGAFTDSPGGPYPAHANAVLALRPVFDLRAAANAVLSYRERIATEPWHDRCFVEAWTPRRGWEPLFVHPGGVESITRRRDVSLAAYAGESEVRLRFRLAANGERQAGGWTIDDIEVWAYGDGDRLAQAVPPSASPALLFPGAETEPLEAAE
jgi:hypothetical protein